MIKIDLLDVQGFLPSLHGMRNPHNSWDKQDSKILSTSVDETGEVTTEYDIGENDHTLAMKLSAGGSVHAKYRRMIVVYADIIAPLYWWKEFDTYRMGVEKDSCSTMHTIHQKPFELDDFSHEHLNKFGESELQSIIDALNINRAFYLEFKDKEYWWQMIQLLPSSYNQRRTVMISYEALANMYRDRKDHKLNEWVDFCKWAKELPCSEFFTGGE